MGKFLNLKNYRHSCQIFIYSWEHLERNEHSGVLGDAKSTGAIRLRIGCTWGLATLEKSLYPAHTCGHTDTATCTHWTAMDHPWATDLNSCCCKLQIAIYIDPPPHFSLTCKFWDLIHVILCTSSQLSWCDEAALSIFSESYLQTLDIFDHHSSSTVRPT